MADDIQVKIGADTSGVEQGTDKVVKSVEGIGEIATRIGSAVTLAGVGMVAAFALVTVATYKFADSMAELASKSERAMATLGASSSEVAALNGVAAATGSTLEAMVSAMSRFGIELTKSGNAETEFARGLQAIGLSAKQFTDLGVNERMTLLANTLAKVEDGSEKTRIVTALLGAEGLKLLPILNEGGEGWQRYADMVQRAGTDLGPVQDKFNETGDRLSELRLSFTGLGIAVFSVLKPAFDGIVQTLSNVVQGFTTAITEGGVFRGILETLSFAAKSLATALAVSVMGVQLLWAAFKGFLNAAADGLGLLVQAITRAFSGDFAGARAALGQMGAAMAQDFAKSQREIVGAMAGATKSINAIWGQAGEERVKIEQNVTAKMREANRDGVATRMRELQGEIALIKEGLRQKSAILDMEVQMGQRTQDSKYAQLMRYTEDAYQAELRVLQAEAQIGGLKASQREAINQRIALLEQQHRTQMINLDRQSLQAQFQMWSQYTNALAGAFNGQLRGLLTGQISFAQAMKNVLLDMTIFMIEALVTKPVAAFLAGQLAKLTATQTGAAAEAAAALAGSTATLPLRVAKFTSDITADAAMVFGGVFANLAPIMGPAAAGPAAASEATVLTQMAAVPKFDVGTPYVRSSGLAMIHQGEKIIPAEGSGPWQGGEGGGHTIQVNIQAMDGADAMRVFKRHARDLGDVLKLSARKTNSKGLSPKGA